ncbi:AraC family transcriptional regulator [Paraburkholderia acidisoli]|uniref:Helix-turn-helix domain-containing protein n=1 Tax=Paraburkholderia acidisoli TaxID=2571748 RepID=A0A7Z2GLZ7_9BURK|nr:AraC family transcriptional regulator [Paraburkholderia acidisoli]QGZ64245.1 helix-turn-helix domain-containing protein [Paraburkholderia acidisoli]
MNADPLSDILRLTCAQSLVTGGFCAGGSWAIRFPAPTKIKFFAIARGHCWVTIDGEAESIRFNEGDVGLMTMPRAFVVSSEPGLVPVDAMRLFSGAGKSPVCMGDGQDFAYIGGHVLLDAASGQLLANVLPPWIRIDASRTQASAFRWLLAELVAERADTRAGAQLATAHLAQLLFIQILRAHMETDAVLSAGWFRAMSDRRLAPALALMHGEPARSWRLEELADACAMSRTTFALRFKTTAGVPALTYLAEWRMRLAERALRAGATPVAVIAESIGYASESAFSNAFKRSTGHSPREYRNAARLAGMSDDVLAAGQTSV